MVVFPVGQYISFDDIAFGHWALSVSPIIPSKVDRISIPSGWRLQVGRTHLDGARVLAVRHKRRGPAAQYPRRGTRRRDNPPGELVVRRGNRCHWRGLPIFGTLASRRA